MNCCCPHSKSAGRIIGKFASRYRKRFAKKGFEPSQQQLLDGVRRSGFEGASILEIGCGVGQFHQALLEQGASTATGIDLSDRMLDEARAAAAQRGLQDRTRYLVGDFVSMESVPRADVTILDKVICCYPDVEQLVRRSAAATTRVYGFTMPKRRWYTRAPAAAASLVLRLMGSDFRPYVHSPQTVHELLDDNGFAQAYERHTALWLTRVYHLVS